MGKQGGFIHYSFFLLGEASVNTREVACKELLGVLFLLKPPVQGVFSLVIFGRDTRNRTEATCAQDKGATTTRFPENQKARTLSSAGPESQKADRPDPTRWRARPY